MSDNTENNMLIAEFIEVQVATRTDGTTSFNPDKSWEVLMPIVVNILTYHQSTLHLMEPNYLAYQDLWEAEMSPDCKCRSLGKGKTPIEAVYNAVIEYIKWSNKTK